MHCYKRLPQIRAISFDLDDTLYDNGPILRASEDAQLAYLHKSVPETLNTDLTFWQDYQRQYGKDNPNIIHDMAKFRMLSIYQGLLQVGLPDKDAHVHAQAAYEAFFQRRIRVSIDGAVQDLLQRLCGQYPLIAITNGTASIEKMGLHKYFEFAIHGGQDGLKQKPAMDMYKAAARRLGINCENLLHIGDSYSHDVLGALRAGCSALWLNQTGEAPSTKSALPHIEITDLHQLEGLL